MACSKRSTEALVILILWKMLVIVIFLVQSPLSCLHIVFYRISALSTKRQHVQGFMRQSQNVLIVIVLKDKDWVCLFWPCETEESRVMFWQEKSKNPGEVERGHPGLISQNSKHQPFRSVLEQDTEPCQVQSCGSYLTLPACGRAARQKTISLKEWILYCCTIKLSCAPQ